MNSGARPPRHDGRHLTLLLVVGVCAVASLLPFPRLWGLNHFHYLPGGFALLWVLPALLVFRPLRRALGVTRQRLTALADAPGVDVLAALLAVAVLRTCRFESALRTSRMITLMRYRLAIADGNATRAWGQR